MTMTLDPNQQRFGPLSLGPMSSYGSHAQFSNPWASSATAAASVSQPSTQNLPLPQPTSSAPSLYQHHHSQESHLPNLNLGTGLAKPTPSDTRPSAQSGVSLASYASLPVSAAAAGSPHTSDPYRQQQDLLSMPQDLLHLSRLAHPTTSAGYGSTVYSAAPSPVSPSFASSSTAGFDHLGYAAASSRSGFGMPDLHSSRRYPQQLVVDSSLGLVELSVSPTSVSSANPVMVPAPGSLSVPPSSAGNNPSSDLNCRPPPDDRRSFQDALEASQGMLSMSQETPRNIYDVRNPNRQRGSADSYGFPSAHSADSSMSSGSFSGYYATSVDGNVSDYSTAGSDIESLSGRTALPRLQPPLQASHHHHHHQHRALHHQHQQPQQPPAPQSMMGSFSSKISSTAQKKHKCKVCDKRFTRPSSLQTHMYSHTGEKPFACQVPGCGRQFSVVSNLRRHKKVHKGADDQELDSASQDAETPSEAGSEEHQSD